MSEKEFQFMDLWNLLARLEVSRIREQEKDAGKALSLVINRMDLEQLAWMIIRCAALSEENRGRHAELASYIIDTMKERL